MNSVNTKVVLAVGGVVLGLVVMYIVATYAIPMALITLTKAAPSSIVSASGSYVIGSRILAKADGKDKCKVNVFLVDSTGKGVLGKAVELTGAENIVALGGQTDTNGMMGFEVTSAKEGQFELMATVGGVTLPRTVKVTFRNQL